MQEGIPLGFRFRCRYQVSGTPTAEQKHMGRPIEAAAHVAVNLQFWTLYSIKRIEKLRM